MVWETIFLEGFLLGVVFCMVEKAPGGFLSGGFWFDAFVLRVFGGAFDCISTPRVEGSIRCRAMPG